jgi:hypothetical protein
MQVVRGTDASAASTCFGGGKLHCHEIQDDVVPPIHPNRPAKSQYVRPDQLTWSCTTSAS